MAFGDIGIGTVIGIVLSAIALVCGLIIYFIPNWSELRRRLLRKTYFKGTNVEALAEYVTKNNITISHQVAEDMKGSKGYVLAVFHPSERLELRQAIYLFGLVSLAKAHFNPMVIIKDDLLIYRSRVLGIMDPDVSKIQSKKFKDRLKRFFRDRNLHIDILYQSTLISKHSRRWIELYLKLGSCLSKKAINGSLSIEDLAAYDTLSPFLEQTSPLMGTAFVSLLWELGKRPLVVLCWRKRQLLWSELISTRAVDDTALRFLYYPTIGDKNYADIVNAFVVSRDEVIKCQATDTSHRVQEYEARWDERYNRND